jgi:hypothetical protein
LARQIPSTVYPFPAKKSPRGCISLGDDEKPWISKHPVVLPGKKKGSAFLIIIILKGVGVCRN